MPNLLVRHKVEDFATWKQSFDEHASARESFGLKELQILRNSNDPAEVVVLFETQDHAKAQEFISSEALHAAMQRAGVADKPDIYFLDQA